MTKDVKCLKPPRVSERSEPTVYLVVGVAVFVDFRAEVIAGGAIELAVGVAVARPLQRFSRE